VRDYEGQGRGGGRRHPPHPEEARDPGDPAEPDSRGRVRGARASRLQSSEGSPASRRRASLA
jgi:hypothetical protein